MAPGFRDIETQFQPDRSLALFVHGRWTRTLCNNFNHYYVPLEAPVEWRAIDPVVANVGYSGIVTKAPHPHAALLFIDYLHSKEGQQFIVKGGLSSPRDDVESLVNQKFKKTYFEAKYSLDEYDKKLLEWEELILKLFVRKR